MSTQANFAKLVAGAYRRLYDFAELRAHPIAEYLLETSNLSPKEKGWRLHHLLLEAIDELAPDENAPAGSHEWRRHRIMVLRYVDALSPEQVADKLGLSRRQFYREHRVAIEVVAEALWQRRLKRDMPESLDHEELLRIEAARVASSTDRSDIREVLYGVFELFKKLLTQRMIEVNLDISSDTPLVQVGHNLLRQMLIGLFGYWVQRIDHSVIRISDHINEKFLILHVSIDPFPRSFIDDFDKWLLLNGELLEINNGKISIYMTQDAIYSFQLMLPIYNELTVLIVDDNGDMLELYKRYLIPNGYRTFTAQTVSEALEFLQRSQPFCIIIDLMMSDRDGWDLLGDILSNPKTARIPTLICSVLKQRDLALALGATVFLEKPITESTLLTALSEIEKRGGM